MLVCSAEGLAASCAKDACALVALCDCPAGTVIVYCTMTAAPSLRADWRPLALRERLTATQLWGTPARLAIAPTTAIVLLALATKACGFETEKVTVPLRTTNVPSTTKVDVVCAA